MKPSIQDAAQNISATAETTPGFSHDVFALTDEQILEIQPDQTVDPQRDSEQAGSELLDSASRTFAPADPQPVNAAATGSPSVVTLDAQPPRWLADMMADARSGGEARDFWNGVTQARQESAAYREVFPEPAAARHAADRAHTLDEIDRAYFAGDSGQRSQLAARMMQQDPAAFREMVFAGLRALETGQAGASPSLGSTREALTAVANPSTNTAATLAAATQQDAILSAYSTFEKSANEELERTVGGAIHRTLEQALPSNGRADSATLKTRLVAEIRQDIEKTLQSDRQLGEQVSRVLSTRRLDSETRGQVVKLINDRAQQLVPGAAKRILGDWTQATLTAHRERSGRSASASSRQEVLPASAGTPTARAASAQSGAPREVDYRKLSDEQILAL